jgi:hypothetical protein
MKLDYEARIKKGHREAVKKGLYQLNDKGLNRIINYSENMLLSGGIYSNYDRKG